MWHGSSVPSALISRMLLTTYFSSEKRCSCPLAEVFTVASDDAASPRIMVPVLNVLLKCSVTLLAAGWSSSLLHDMAASDATDNSRRFFRFFILKIEFE